MIDGLPKVAQFPVALSLIICNGPGRLAWPPPEEMEQDELELLLFPSASTTPFAQHFLPDLLNLHRIEEKHIISSLATQFSLFNFEIAQFFHDKAEPINWRWDDQR